MTYDQALETKKIIEAEHKAASDAVRAVPGIGSGPLGLTPDVVKASVEYRAANARYNAVHAKLRAYNQWFLKTHGAQYRREYRRAG